MATALVALMGCALLGLLLLVFYLFFRQGRQLQDSSRLEARLDHLQNQLRINLDGNTQLITQQVQILTQQLGDRLGQSAELTGQANQQINERLDNAAKVFGELQNRLGKLSEANERIYNVGKDISSLQEILRSPKARGSVGEFLLADILTEMLPRERFELQYRFRNNEIVDAVVKIGEQLLSVDAKFPLDNFRRLVETQNPEERLAVKKLFSSDVKKQIDSIARKYILPEEGTFDYAFMYVPAENVYYELIVRDSDIGEAQSIQSYGFKKKVIVVSPNSFYAYLATLVYALRGQRVQQNVVEVLAHLRQLFVELGKFREDFERVGFHLNNLRSSYESSDKRLNRFEERLHRVQEEETLFDAPEKPVKLITN